MTKIKLGLNIILKYIASSENPRDLVNRILLFDSVREHSWFGNKNTFPPMDEFLTYDVFWNYQDLKEMYGITGFEYYALLRCAAEGCKKIIDYNGLFGHVMETSKDLDWICAPAALGIFPTYNRVVEQFKEKIPRDEEKIKLASMALFSSYMEYRKDSKFLIAPFLTMCAIFNRKYNHLGTAIYAAFEYGNSFRIEDLIGLTEMQIQRGITDPVPPGGTEKILDKKILQSLFDTEIMNFSGLLPRSINLLKENSPGEITEVVECLMVSGLCSRKEILEAIIGLIVSNYEQEKNKTKPNYRFPFSLLTGYIKGGGSVHERVPGVPNTTLLDYIYNNFENGDPTLKLAFEHTRGETTEELRKKYFWCKASDIRIQEREKYKRMKKIFSEFHYYLSDAVFHNVPQRSFLSGREKIVTTSFDIDFETRDKASLNKKIKNLTEEELSKFEFFFYFKDEDIVEFKDIYRVHVVGVVHGVSKFFPILEETNFEGKPVESRMLEFDKKVMDRDSLINLFNFAAENYNREYSISDLFKMLHAVSHLETSKIIIDRLIDYLNKSTRLMSLKKLYKFSGVKLSSQIKHMVLS